jgi:arylsulfatase A-like enzyme
MSLTRRRLLASAAGAAYGQTRANVVVLFTDDQRFDTVRALGNREIHTPNLDRLVARGTAFTHACIMGGSMGAVCVPSRAMLLTGQSLWRAHALKQFHLFPEEMRRTGYAAFATGKWHNAPALFNRCFDAGENIFFGGMSDQLKTPIQPYDRSGGYTKDRARTTGRFSSELFTDAAVKFLEDYKGSEPFLLYVAYTSPHDPRMAPEKYAQMYRPERITVPPNFMRQHPFDNGEMKVRDELLEAFPRTREAIQRHIASYYAMVSEVDAQIGRVLETIERTGRTRNTIVVFAGDNGLAVGQHGLLGKQNLYDHSVRVPLIISGPGIPAGRRVDSLVYLYDLFPTIAELTGVPVPSTVEGKSLVPLLRGRASSVRDSAYFAYRHLQRAVRKDRWKLIVYDVNGVETVQLFDVKADPWETRNLVEAEPARVRELRALLREWMSRVDDPLPANQERKII